VEWECAGGWVDGGIVAYFFLLAVALPSLTVLGACVTFRITREEERARVDAAEGEAGRGRRRHCSPRHASLRSAPRIYRCVSSIVRNLKLLCAIPAHRASETAPRSSRGGLGRRAAEPGLGGGARGPSSGSVAPSLYRGVRLERGSWKPQTIAFY
jgi:hypothetical protein